MKNSEKKQKLKSFLTTSLIEAHKTRWDWKTILNVLLNVPLNETHITTWRGLLYPVFGDISLYALDHVVLPASIPLVKTIANKTPSTPYLRYERLMFASKLFPEYGMMMI